VRLVWVVIPLVLVVSIIGIIGIQESHSQYMNGSIPPSEEWSNAAKNAVQEYVDSKLLQNETILKDSIKTRIIYGGQDDIPQTYYARILYDVIYDKKIQHVDSAYKVVFLSWNNTSADAILEKTSETEYKPPKKIEFNYDIDEDQLNIQRYHMIMCRQGFEKIMKESTGDTVCVKPETARNLIERGWAIYLTSFEDKNPTNTTIPVDLDSTNIIDANNQFAIDFYSKVSQESDDNIFFSPWSVMTAFAIVHEGAKGNTAEQMQNVFGFSSNETQRQNEFKSVNDELNQKDSSYKLQVANGLWLANFFEPLKEYVDIAKNYYDSEVSAVNFVGNEGVDTINSWVSEKTNDKIKDILEPGSTNADTRLVITNAIYFKGTWITQFDEENTSEQNFTVDSDTITKTPMMNLHQTQQVYGETDEIKILELPYEGDKLSMLLLLPKEIDGMDDLENSLTVENLKQWRESLSIHDVRTVSIPKFELETDYNLIPPLHQLGISDAFDENKADFSGITTSESLFIVFALHKAYVDVNEEGTEAAAVTAIGVGLTSVDPNPPPVFTFVADHPFIFVIQDNETGHILFMGKMTNPSE